MWLDLIATNNVLKRFWSLMVLIRPATYQCDTLKKKKITVGVTGSVLTVEVGMLTPSRKGLERSYLEYWIQVRSVPCKKA